MNAQDWQLVGIAAGIATAAATALSFALSVLWRMLDRKRADWVTFDGSSKWLGRDPYSDTTSPPSAQCEFANTGDGTAFGVRAVGLGCAVDISGEQRTASKIGLVWRPEYTLVPVMHPGDRAHLSVSADPRIWDEAEVAIIWTASPTWLRRLSRRKRYVPLRSIAERPQLSRKGFDEATGQTTRESLLEPAPEVIQESIPQWLREARKPRPTKAHWVRRWRLTRELKRLR